MATSGALTTANNAYMRLEVGYTVSGSNVTINSLTGWRTNGYTTSSNHNSDKIHITVNGVKRDFTAINNWIYFKMNNQQTTFWNAGSTWDCSGKTSVTVTVTFSGTSVSNIDGASFSFNISGLATAPTGVSCSLSSYTETRATVSGSYSSNGGSAVLGSGYEYKTTTGNWTAFSNGSTALDPGTTYYFRYYVRNAVGTTYSTNTCSCTTYKYPEVTGYPNLIIGNQLTISFTNPRGLSCAVYLILANGEQYGGDTTTGTSISGYNGAGWKQYFWSSIPSANSGQYKVRLVTSSIGRDITVNGGTYSTNGSELPTFLETDIIDIKDTLHVTDITGDNSKFISGHNKLTGTIKPMSSNYYASLSGYSIVCGGVNSWKDYSSNNISFELNNVSSSVLTVTATDARTKTQSRNKNITIIPYSKPTMTEHNITRQNGTGEYAIFSFKGAYANWSSYNLKTNNNVTSAQYRYKEQGSNNWSGWTNLTSKVSSGGIWSVNEVITVAFNNATRYDVEIKVTDLLESTTFTGLLISTANAFIWKDLTNKRVGIGKKPDYNLDIQGSINATDALYINGVKALWYE